MAYKCIMNIIGEDFLGQFEGEFEEVPSNETVMNDLEGMADMVEEDPMIKVFQPDLIRVAERLKETERIELTLIDQEGVSGKIERTFNYESPEIRYLRALANGETQAKRRAGESRDVAKHVVDVIDRIESPRVRVKMNQRSIREVCEVCAQI